MSRTLGGRFVLEREIGAGGMSVIFLGKDKVLDRPVAVKVLKSGFEGSDVGSRFRREGRTAARLSHPNIVQVYDAGEDELDGREVSYIVMEYVPGGDLGRLVTEKGPLEERDLARIGADVASGLAHAHRKGVVHRDIKPQNILIDDYGHPKLADFGIARALDTTETTTKTGAYLGTASYSSPEQLRGEQITPKSDIYSFGCTLYETAVGEPIFSGSPIATANQQLTKFPVPPRARGADLGEPFENLILACLAKDPTDRPDATGLQERLLRISAVASGAVSAGPALGEIPRTLAGTAAPGASAMTRGFGAVVRGVRDRVGSTRASQRTLFEPTQILDRTPQQGRNRRRVPLVLGVLAVLLLASVAAMGVPALLGAGEEDEQPEEVAVVSPIEQPKTPETEETTATTSVSRPTPPPSQAEEVVWDMYVQASYRDFDTAWSYLSEEKQDEEGSPEQWAEKENFDTLTYVFFTQVPDAELSGEDSAMVRFQVRETRNPGGVTLLTGTWECVNEGGEWKLDRLVRG